MLQGVIFDMDGLLFDTERLAMEAFDYAGEKTGVGRAGDTVLETLGLNRAATDTVLRRRFGEAFDVDAFRRQAALFLEAYYAEHAPPVKKGLLPLLEYLEAAGLPAAVASSSERAVVLHHLEAAGIRQCFAAVVGGDMVTASKPAPDIYLEACRRLGLPPEACLALEDSKNGLLAAYSAGCRPFMIPDLWQPDGETEKILAGRAESLCGVIDYLKRERMIEKG